MPQKIKKICIFTEGYPTANDPKCPFVEQLVMQFADNGLECTVIDPLSYTKIIKHRYELRAKYRTSITEKGNVVEIFSPRCISASTRRIGPINTSEFTLKEFMRAADSIVRSRRTEFDAFYGHFIYPSGIIAATLGRKYNIPAFFAYGENTNYTIDYLGVKKTKELLRNIDGVISVSTANKQNLTELDVIAEEKIEVFPNSINNKLFYKRNKMEMRRKYNLPESAFIIAFVGRFIEIKGANRLSLAIDKLHNDNVKSLFLGSGNIQPNCKGILYIGSQPHQNVPELLSAADIFVLPTRAEGCCNAIIEAMACGLPIVSSNLPFNDDILDETCSLRIDPTNIDEIAAAVQILMTDEGIRGKLADGALEKAKQLNIEIRARRIIDFMERKIR